MVEEINNWAKEKLRSLAKAVGAYWGVLTIAIVLLAVIGIALRRVYNLEWADWTGFENYTDTKRTLWDWLELLIVPVVLALGALWFNKTEKQNELKIAKERNENEQKIAADRQREEALQSYFDKMTELLLHEKQPLREASETTEVRIVARTRTLATLRMLDSLRKGLLLRFLYEVGLIAKDQGRVDVRGADLSEANLYRAALYRADLHETDLREADLREADLRGADLNRAELSSAYLNKADLVQADLRGANLGDAYLSEANLGAANLYRANLRGADLSHADLFSAYMSQANLSRANLSKANLSKADLSGADLSGAIVEREQWSTAMLSEYTIMPDGEKYGPAIHGETIDNKMEPT